MEARGETRNKRQFGGFNPPNALETRRLFCVHLRLILLIPKKPIALPLVASDFWASVVPAKRDTGYPKPPLERSFLRLEVGSDFVVQLVVGQFTVRGL